MCNANSITDFIRPWSGSKCALANLLTADAEVARSLGVSFKARNSVASGSMLAQLFLVLISHILMSLTQDNSAACAQNISDYRKGAARAKLTPNASVPIQDVGEVEESYLALKCSLTDITYRALWYENYEYISPSRKHVSTRGRVKVDERKQRIIFDPVAAADNGVYTCTTKLTKDHFQQHASFRLKVRPATWLEFRSPKTWMRWATVVAVIVFLVLYVPSWRRSMRSGSKTSDMS